MQFLSTASLLPLITLTLHATVATADCSHGPFAYGKLLSLGNKCVSVAKGGEHFFKCGEGSIIEQSGANLQLIAGAVDSTIQYECGGEAQLVHCSSYHSKWFAAPGCDKRVALIHSVIEGAWPPN